jgi:hypothetical protein
MKGFRRSIITALLLAGMAEAAFCGTDYFLVVEQKPGGGFAQAVAMAIIPLLDDADTVSIVGVSNTVTLLLPPMPLGTSGLLAMVNDVLLKPVPQIPGKTPPPYSPAMAAAVNLAEEQAGALALAQPGRDARMVILAETTPKADGVFSPYGFARIDYISLNAAADPTLAALAVPPGDVWDLAEQPDPNADPPARPFAEGFLEFVKTINGNYTTAKIGEAGDGFTLGDLVHTVHKAVVITAGAEAVVSKKGSSPDEEAYQYGNYAAAIPGAGGGYTIAGAQVVFAAELKALSPVVFMVIGITVAAVILIIVIAGIAIRNRTIKQRKPVFKIELFDLTYGTEKYDGSLTCAIGKKQNPQPDDDYTEQFVSGAALWDVCKAFQIPGGEDTLAYMLYKEGEEGQELIFAKQSKVLYDEKAGVWKIIYPVGSDPDAVDNTGKPYPTEETITETRGETFYTRGRIFYNSDRNIALGFTKL